MIPLIGLQPDEIEPCWPTVRPFIAKAMARTGIDKNYDVDHLLQYCKKGEMQVWVGHDDVDVVVVHVTEVEVYPKRKILAIPFTGAVEGTIDDWLDHIKVFEAFAQAHGCAAVRGFGRLGWIKKLEPDHVRVEFDIEVSDENIH